MKQCVQRDRDGYKKATFCYINLSVDRGGARTSSRLQSVSAPRSTKYIFFLSIASFVSLLCVCSFLYPFHRSLSLSLHNFNIFIHAYLIHSLLQFSIMNCSINPSYYNNSVSQYLTRYKILPLLPIFL